jgi:hypothetical protein
MRRETPHHRAAVHNAVCRGRGDVERGTAMDAAITEDVVFLGLIFLIAIGLTAAILIWGRATWRSQT